MSTKAEQLALLKKKLSMAKTKIGKAVLEKKIEKLKSEMGSSIKAKKEVTEAKKKVSQMSVAELKKKPEFKFLKGMNKGKIEDDQKRVAKPKGWRFKGKGKYRKPTKAEISQGKNSGNVYYEARNRHSDVSRIVRLKDGGGVGYKKDWEVVGITMQGKKFKKVITLGRLSDQTDVKNALRRMDLNIREVTSIKELNTYANGGGVRDNNGLSNSDKFISDQLYYVISLKSISEKKKVIKDSLLPNIDDYVTDNMTNKITKDNLKYALQQKTVASINNVLKGTINAFRKDEFANGGGVGDVVLYRPEDLKDFWSNPKNSNKTIYFVEEMEEEDGEPYYVVGNQTKKYYDDSQYWDYDYNFDDVDEAVKQAKLEAKKNKGIYAENLRVIRGYAKGGGVMEKKYAIYEVAFGQPYNFYNEEQDKFIWSEPTKATLFTKKEAENKRAELLKPRIEHYQSTGKNYQELHIGDLFEKGILKKYATGGGVKHSKKLDKKQKALHTGKRVSESGNTYYEYRMNHADNDRRTRLEEGGDLFTGEPHRNETMMAGGKVKISDFKYEIYAENTLTGEKFTVACVKNLGDIPLMFEGLKKGVTNSPIKYGVKSL